MKKGQHFRWIAGTGTVSYINAVWFRKVLLATLHWGPSSYFHAFTLEVREYFGIKGTRKLTECSGVLLWCEFVVDIDVVYFWYTGYNSLHTGDPHSMVIVTLSSSIVRTSACNFTRILVIVQYARAAIKHPPGKLILVR